MIRLDLATDAFIGARSQQQDAAGAYGFGSTGGVVLVLGDGLGGHTGGAEASHIVRETFREAAGAGVFDDAKTRRAALRDALEIANQRIANGVDPSHGQRGMASTVVAVVISDEAANWISVGDSHFYIWRDGQLGKLNEDHSQAGLMLRSGDFQPNDPEVLAAKSILVSALTGRRLELVDHPESSFKLQVGDLLLLASDGLNTLSDEELSDILANAPNASASEITTLLLDAVRDRRADRQDNTAVVVARVLDFADASRSPRTEIVVPTQITAPTDDLYKDSVAAATVASAGGDRGASASALKPTENPAAGSAIGAAAKTPPLQDPSEPMPRANPIAADVSASTRSTYPTAVTPRIDDLKPAPKRRRSKLLVTLMMLLVALGATAASLHYMGKLETILESLAGFAGLSENKVQPTVAAPQPTPQTAPQAQPTPPQPAAPTQPAQQRPAATPATQSPSPGPGQQTTPAAAPVVLPPANDAAAQRPATAPAAPANSGAQPAPAATQPPTLSPGFGQPGSLPKEASPPRPAATSPVTPPAPQPTPAAPQVQQPR